MSGGAGAARRLARRFRSARGITRRPGATAAVVREEADESAHDRVVRAVDQLPTGARLRDEAGALQRLQVERERRRLQADAFADGAGIQAPRALLDEQPVD